MEIDYIRRRVRAIINEYVQEDDMFSLENNSIFNDIIDEAAKEVVQIAPSYYCMTRSTSTNTTVLRPDGRRIAVFSITDDMVKPVEVRSKYLHKSVLEFMPTSDASYAAQYSSAKGVGAGSAKPVAYISGSTDIEVHSLPSDIEEGKPVAMLIYVPIPHVCNDNIDITSVIVPAVCTRAAQMVLEAENSPSSQLVASRYKEIVSEWEQG